MKKKPRPYHHGNLKRALLGAAVDLIGEVGVSAFTLREVARRAGVSHNAPYRHFRDKQDLLNAVAAEGFNRLRESITKAAAPGSSGVERLRLSGRGYVGFALRFPQHLIAMFESPKPTQANPETRVAAERAFGTLLRYIEECQKEASLPEADSMRIALLAWSLVHGIAKLASNGRLPFSRTADVLAFTDAATQAFVSGIANTPNGARARRYGQPADRSGISVQPRRRRPGAGK